MTHETRAGFQYGGLSASLSGIQALYSPRAARKKIAFPFSDCYNVSDCRKRVLFYMNSFVLCLRAVLPAFLIIMAGYASKRAGFVRESDIPAMNKMAYRAFMPVMCFYNVYHSDISSAVRPGLMAFSAVGVLCVYGLSWLYGTLFVKRRDRRGVVIQGLYRSNFLIVGLSFAEGLLGASNS